MLTTALSLSSSFLIALSASQTAFVYDALGRVTKVTYDNGTVVEYQYDAAGNRTQKTVTGSPSSGVRVVVVPLNGFTVIPVP
ncbi:RHS repeat protein [Asticcacaulis sp. DW145]|uniref:RHS repeat domain-containing protein n=1 Tax=Asticcacaulis sp. DW145 TaxID=3095608 RepID=UPI003084EBED|nr:RHS repeat protein [Asticcacaulis sp. DW145]